MKKRLVSILLVLCMALALAPTAAVADAPKVTINEKYLFAGKVGEWYTEEGYRTSPVVIDLDGDGTLEVINAVYSLYVMDAATGEVKWKIKAGKDRSTNYDKDSNCGAVFNTFKVADIDDDGKNEIVIGYGDGTLSVLNEKGYFEYGWPKKLDAPISSLVVDDLNRDDKKEIIVGLAHENPLSVWVYDCYGNVLPGWPQLNAAQDGGNFLLEDTGKLSTTGYSAGIYANGIITGDLNGDGYPEIIVPTDTQYVCAYNRDGTLVTASSIYNDKHGRSRTWGKIAFYEDYAEEKASADNNEGWGWSTDWGGLQSRKDKYRAQMTTSGTAYTDLDGDGKAEIVITAYVEDRTQFTLGGNNTATIKDSKFMTVFVLNQDRSRYNNTKLGFNWEVVPNELNSSIGGPLRQKYTNPAEESKNANVCPVPVCEDIDGDGYKEIIFNSYDGMVHCFSLDRTEKWSFRMPKTTSTIYEYAAAPTCADLDGDGKMEVLFASWTDSEDGYKRPPAYYDYGGTGVNGALYILSSEGELLASKDLHKGYALWEDDVRDKNPNGYYTNGVWGAPTVADIDNDGEYEVLLNTRYYALCAYDLDVESATPTPEPTPEPTPTPDTPDIEFTDVTSGWYYNYVRDAARAGLINGVGDNKFEPEAPLNRSQFLALIVRAVYGEPENIPNASNWFDKYYDFAGKNGLLNGIPDDVEKEGDNGKIPRYEMAQMLYNAAVYKGLDVESASKDFPDSDHSYSTTYDKAIKYAYGMGLINGVDASGDFAGMKTLERAQAAKVIWLFYELTTQA